MSVMATIRRTLRLAITACVLGSFVAVPSDATPPVLASHTPAAPFVASSFPAATLTSGVAPTRTEADVLKIATSHLDGMAGSAVSMGLDPAPNGSRIESVEAAMWSDIEAYGSGASAPEIGSPDASRILWVVRAEGTFLVVRSGLGRDPWVGKTGYLLIDDETGMIVGMGTP